MPESRKQPERMGIQGLLGLLEEAIHDVHISELRGKRVAIDGYCWLHRATYSCALELCTGGETSLFLGYCEAMLDMLLHFDITPIVVLDGGPLPSKAHQEDLRRRRREENQRKGRDALAAGNRKVAMTHFQRAVDVTPEMAAMFENMLRRRGISFIVAPFEADAQLAFLQKNGIVDFVLTEDSDMIPYGVSCIVFKMDKSGQGKILRLDEALRTKAVFGLSQTSLRHACILSGCDYLEGLSGMGLKTAVKTVRRYREIGQAIRALKLEGQHKVPEGYEEQFLHAELTFCHQQVFDPGRRAVVPLNPLPENLTWADLQEFLGETIPQDIACEIAEGKRDPISREYFPSFAAPKSPVVQQSVEQNLRRSVSTPVVSSSVKQSHPSPRVGLLKFFTPVSPEPTDSKFSSDLDSTSNKNSPSVMPALSPALKRPFISPVRSSESSQTSDHDFESQSELNTKRRRISKSFSDTFFGRTSDLVFPQSFPFSQSKERTPVPTEDKGIKKGSGDDDDDDEVIVDEDTVKERSSDHDGDDDGDGDVVRPKTLYRSSFLAHGRLTLPPKQFLSRSSSIVSTSLALDSDPDESSVSEVSEASSSNHGFGCHPEEKRNGTPSSVPAPSRTDCNSLSAISKGPTFLSRFFIPKQPNVPYPSPKSQ